MNYFITSMKTIIIDPQIILLIITIIDPQIILLIITIIILLINNQIIHTIISQILPNNICTKIHHGPQITQFYRINQIGQPIRINHQIGQFHIITLIILLIVNFMDMHIIVNYELMRQLIKELALGY